MCLTLSVDNHSVIVGGNTTWWERQASGLGRSREIGGLCYVSHPDRKVRTMSIAIAAEREFTVPEGALVRVAWTERERGMPGLTLHLSLDDEVEEYTLRVAPEVAADLIEFFQRSAQARVEVEPQAPRLLTLAANHQPARTPPRWAEASFMRT